MRIEPGKIIFFNRVIILLSIDKCGVSNMYVPSLLSLDSHISVLTQSH